MKRLCYLCLLALFGLVAIAQPLYLANYQWGGCGVAERFYPLAQLEVRELPDYRERLVPYLNERGVSDEEEIEQVVKEDLSHLSHALSILFLYDPREILQRFLGEHGSLLNGLQARIDHVGRELYGPLSFYLPVLRSMADQLGLTYVRDFVFPSTQVVRVLQEQDPSVQGVAIGRAYFSEVQTGNVGCLELFQAARMDDLHPQCIRASRERLSLLVSGCPSDSTITPIDHLSLELKTPEAVYEIHDRLHQFQSETMSPYQAAVSHNPGDGSTNTKAVLRDASDTPFNKVIEFVHYGAPEKKPE